MKNTARKSKNCFCFVFSILFSPPRQYIKLVQTSRKELRASHDIKFWRTNESGEHGNTNEMESQWPYDRKQHHCQPSCKDG